ncbi:MAG: hypothetical protein AAF602_30755, partial [Myxococcota bacterium]
IAFSDAALLFEGRSSRPAGVPEELLAVRTSSDDGFPVAPRESGCPGRSARRLDATLMVHGGSREASRMLARSLELGRPVLALGIDGVWTAARSLARSRPASPVHFVAFELACAVASRLGTTRDVRVRLAFGGPGEVRDLPPELRVELGRSRGCGR